MRPQLIFKAIFFTLFLPGGVTVFVPFIILGESIIDKWPELSVLRVLVALVGVIASGILFHCIWAFASFGKGTLAPIHPPVSLVIRGLYRYTRNPMYLAVFVVLLTETLFFQSLNLLIYTATILLGFYLFVRFYEEPHLRNHFGEQYIDYCRVVPRWGVTIHPFNNTGGAT